MAAGFDKPGEVTERRVAPHGFRLRQVGRWTPQPQSA